MRKHQPLLLAAAIISLLASAINSHAQNSSPYWSLAGNSNAISSSHKLGTTNAYPLRITTNNTTRIFVSPNAGYIGVGTTAPSSRLHVNSASGTSPLKFQINGTTKLYMNSSGGLSVGSGSAAPANGLYVAGNVGVGTTVPTSRLTVSSTLGVSPFQVLVGGVPQLFVGVEGGLSVGTNTPSPVKGLRVEGTVIIGKSSETDQDYSSALTVANGGIVVHNSSIGIEAFGDFSTGTGVVGKGFTGVLGRSLDGTGVYADGAAIGLDAKATNNEGIGVEATSSYIGVHAFGPYVGVYGVSDNYAGYFEGDVYASGTYQPSTRNLKQNITGLTSAMVLLTKLQPKVYEYKHDGAYKLMNLPKGKRYGLIAEEVEQVLPGLVKTTRFDPHTTQHVDSAHKQQGTPSEKIEFKALNYTELIPIIIKGMQEQDQHLQQQEAENKALKAEVAELRLMVLELKRRAGTITTSAAYLEQNSPNPVRGTTTIRYYIPESLKDAQLNITNTKGQLVKSISLNSKGTGQLTLNTGILLASGTYFYTLFVDGKQMDSKSLIIAQ